MFPLFLFFPSLANLSWRIPSIGAAVFLLVASVCPAQSVLDDPALSEYRALETGNAPQPPPAAPRTAAKPTAPPSAAARSAAAPAGAPAVVARPVTPSDVPPQTVAPGSAPTGPATVASSASTPDTAASGHVLFIPWASRKSASPQERAAQERSSKPIQQPGLGASRPGAGQPVPTPPPALVRTDTRREAVGAPAVTGREAVGAPTVTPQAVTPPAASSAGPYVERAPLCGVLDLDAGRNVDPATASTLSLALWGEIQRAQRVHLQMTEATRHVLARQGLTPGDPYKAPPQLSRVSAAVGADYLFLGNVDQAEGVWLLEVMLYSAATNSLVRSQAARSPERFEGLLDQMPGIVHSLLEAVPARVLARTNANGPSEVAPYSPSVEEELQQLRRENARLNSLLGPGSGASTSYAAGSPAAGRSASSPPAPEGAGETLPPVRYGNKEAPRTKTVVAKATPAEPTPVTAPTVPAVAPPEPSPAATSSAMRPLEAPEPTPATLTGRAAVGAAAVTAAGTPTPAVAPSPTPARTPAAAPAPPTTPPPATPAADPQAEAKSLSEQAMRSPKTAREALDPLRRAVDLQPANSAYRDELMVRLFESKEYTDCARRATQLTREGKTDGALSLLYGAAAHTYLGDYKNALAALDLLLSKDPANGFALYNRAYNLKAMNDPRAADAFEVYLKTAGNDPAHAQWVLDAHNKLNELRKATPATDNR